MNMHDERVKKLEEELAKAKTERDALNAMLEDQRLAIYLHEKNCHSNHEDGCGWFYEISKGVHNWNGSSHKRFLDLAQHIIGLAKKFNLTVEQVLEIRSSPNPVR